MDWHLGLPMDDKYPLQEPANATLSLDGQLKLPSHPQRESKDPRARALKPASIEILTCCFTRAKPASWRERPQAHGTLGRAGSFDFVWPALRAGHTPLRMTALLRSTSGSCRGRFLWRPLRTMLWLVRGFVSAIILYHDIHQLLLGVDVAFHAFTGQLCQW